MAALTLVLATLRLMEGGLAPLAQAGEPGPFKQKVKLSVQVEGVTSEGGEIVIKPGHPGSKFKTITKPVRRQTDLISIDEPIEVETYSADRDCSIAIILKEPGQPDKIFRRSLQLVPAPTGKAAKPQTLVCYLNSNALSPAPAAMISSKTADETRKK
jgi:hypothetical protein